MDRLVVGNGVNESNDDLRVKGSFEGLLLRGNGDVECVRKDNLIVDVGFKFVADALCLVSSRPSVLSHIAVGSGTTAPAAAQTALTTEMLRKAAAYSYNASTKVVTLTTTFNAGEATGAITEAGILNAATAGILLDRLVFPVINKGAADTFVATFTITLSQV